MTNLDDQEWQPKWVFLDGVGWWPYGDLELDDYERELEESIATGEWRSVPDFDVEKKRYEEIARNTIAGWSKEQLGEVERRASERPAKMSKSANAPSTLADDTVSSDNPQPKENI